MWTAFAILAPVVFFLSEGGVLRKRRSSQIVSPYLPWAQ